MYKKENNILGIKEAKCITATFINFNFIMSLKSSHKCFTNVITLICYIINTLFETSFTIYNTNEILKFLCICDNNLPTLYHYLQDVNIDNYFSFQDFVNKSLRDYKFQLSKRKIIII